MSLAGSLTDFGVAEVFQLIGQQRKTGVLEVESQGRVLEVFFHEGAVLRALPSEKRSEEALCAFLVRVGAVAEADLAEARREQQESGESVGSILEREGLLSKSEFESVAELLTQETLFELFAWERGRFAFRAESIDHCPGDRTLSAESVLLDTLRMRDEWGQIRPNLPEFSSALAHTADVEGFSERRELLAQSSGVSPEHLEQLYRLVDGRSSVQRILDLARLGTFQGARGLAAMLRGGVLRVESARPRVRASPVPRISLGGAVPLVATLAIGTLGLAVQAWFPRFGHSSFPVPATALLDAREASDRERIVVRLEVYRWAHGHYPDALSELEAARWSLLAGDQLAGYSYKRAGDGYRLEKQP